MLLLRWCAAPRVPVKLGLVLGSGLHAVEASCVSDSSLSALRAAVVRSVSSSKVSFANTPGYHITCWMVWLVLIWLFKSFRLGSA